MLKFLIILLIFGLANGNQRIAGGWTANRGDFPYHAHIQKLSNGLIFMCGGSIINEKWVLTSAQCVFTWEAIDIFFGITNKVDGPYDQYVHIFNRDQVKLHPDYNPPNQLSANLAMIYLTEGNSLNFNQYVSSILLPQFGDVGSNFEGLMSVATGFGMTSDEPGSGTSILLKYTNMSVTSNEECARFFGSLINENKICTDASTGRSTCAGDEGAPLVVTLEPERKILIGVGSFRSSAGCQQGHPAVFTRLTKFLEWIKELLGAPQEPPNNDRCKCECHCYTCPAIPQREEL